MWGMLVVVLWGGVGEGWSAEPAGSRCTVHTRPSTVTVAVGESYTPTGFSWLCPANDVIRSVTISDGSESVRSCVVSSEYYNKGMVQVTARCTDALYTKLLSRAVTVSPPQSSLAIRWTVEVVEKR